MATEPNVVPLSVEPDPQQNASSGIEARWGSRLAVPFNPVSRYFLHNYHRLRPHPGARGLNSTEAMLVIQILDHKWDSRAPFPTISTLAKRMGVTARSIRSTLKRLEDLNYVHRDPSPFGGPNKYRFEGLIDALHKLMDADVASTDASAANETSDG